MDLQFIDIFGIGIGLRYLNNKEYQTKFGAFITVVISAVVGIQTFLVGQELFTKNNPEVIYAERFVASPERFNITRKNFNFAFGAQYPSNFSQFIDESIYSVNAQQVSMHKKYNETSGEYYQDWQYLDVGVHPCTTKDFEVEESLDYFHTLPGVDQMYCLDYDSQDLYIQGNFDQDDYGVIIIQFVLCSGKPNCRSPDEIKSIMTNSFVAHYTNDIVINPKNVDPYQIISRDMFWSTNPFYPKDAYLYYRNNYVESDDGVFFSQTSYDKQPSLSYIYDEIIFGETSYFFQMYIRFEKAKESVYHRTYKKLDSVLAEIGGIAKALVIVGYLICMPVNQLKLHEQLSNSLFRFKKAVSLNKQEQRKKSDIQDEKEDDDQIASNQKIFGKNLIQLIEEQQELNKLQFSQNNIPHPFQATSQRLLVNKEISPNPSSTAKIPHFEFVLDNHLSTKRESKSSLKNVMKLINNNPQIDHRQLNLHLNNNDEECVQSKKLYQTEPSDAFHAQSNEQSAHNFTQQSQQKILGSGFNLLKVIQLKKQMKQIAKQQQQSQQVIEIPEVQIKGGADEQKRVQNAINIKNLFNQNNQKKEEDVTSLKLEWTDYIRYYLWPFGEYAKKKKQIDYSVEKIYQHLDMLYIVQKLLELEKLKQVLLTEDQQKLIQFFPKPQIDVDEIESEKVDKEKLEKQKTLAQQKRRTSRRHKSGINLLQDLNLDEKGKAKEAFQALKNIIKKQNLTDIDKKIIGMLDESVLEHIENHVDYLQDLEEKDEINVRQDQQQIHQDFNKYTPELKSSQFESNYINNNHEIIPAPKTRFNQLSKNEKMNISIQSSSTVEQQAPDEKELADGEVQQINQFIGVDNILQQNQNNMSVLQSYKNINSKDPSENRLPESIPKIP